MSVLSHFDEAGNAVMVDVTDKPVTERIAVASGRVLLQPETLALIETGGVKKGDVLSVAQLAGIMGAKRTSELIPLCHPLPLSGVELDLVPREDRVEITARVRTRGVTGVEMEALTAATVAALTVYDMIKAVDHLATIEGVQVLAKSGGKSGDWTRDGAGTSGERETSGEAGTRGETEREDQG